MRHTLVVVALVVGGCSRDLSLPEAAAPGTVTGRVLYAIPARMTREPAVGATVALLGSGLSTTANGEGRFVLQDVNQVEGQLLFRYDLGGDASQRRQRIIQLSLYKTRPEQSIDLGDVLVVENAALHGRVLRADALEQSGGHGGSVVFVPEGPLTTYTGDNGTWSLSELPEGQLQIAFFRAGYVPQTIDTLEARGGTDVAVRDVLLQPLTGTEGGGSITGTLRFVPEAGADGASVTAVLYSGQTTAGQVAADGTFGVSALTPGLYDLAVARAGYSPLLVQNVLVFPDRETRLGVITLTQSAPFDGGLRPPPPDAGPADAGPPDAGPPDAGPPDAGPPDAGPSDAGTCVMNMDCPPAKWCDDGLCVPQCASSAQCTNGRACDLATRTCVTPCAGSCPSPTLCDVTSNLCRAVCDVGSPCDAGFKCSPTSLCVPECSVPADCNRAHTTCHNGQCEPDMSCDTDLDCLSSERCTGTVCVPRSGFTDAGWACAMPCDCRLDETCSNGVCVAAPVPTHFFTADGGQDLRATFPIGVPTNAIVALRADDVFELDAGLFLDGGSITLSGGYVVCGPNRQVFDATRRSTLSSSAQTAMVRSIGVAGAPRADLTVRNLNLQNSASPPCDNFAIEGVQLLRPHVTAVTARFPVAKLTCGSTNYWAALSCTSCAELDARDIELAQSATGGNNSVGVVQLTSSSGRVTQATLRGTSGHATIQGVRVITPAGPLMISGTRIETSSATTVLGVEVRDALATAPITVTQSSIDWPSGGNTFFAVRLTNVADAAVTFNEIDAGTGPTTMASGTAFFLDNSSGVASGNHVSLPTHITSSAVSGVGIETQGSVNAWRITNNSVVGGSLNGASDGMYGIYVGAASIPSNIGPLVVSGNTVLLGTTPYGAAFTAINIGGSAALQVRDNFFRGGTWNLCGGRSLGCVVQNGTMGIFERNRCHAQPSGTPWAFYLSGGQLELYDNHLWVGRSYGAGGCSTATAALYHETPPANLYAVGNTIENEGEVSQGFGSNGILCTQPGSLFFFTSNLIGAGYGPAAYMLYNYSGCTTAFNPANWKKNYFFFSRPGGVRQGGTFEAVNTVVTTGDAGVPDPNGNIAGDLTGCFDLTQPSPRTKLSAASLCIDRGEAGQRQDTSVISLDLDGLPRTLGPAPDIGASELK